MIKSVDAVVINDEEARLLTKEENLIKCAKKMMGWGAKYHELHVGGKPHFDMYICDKSYNAATFFHRKERGLP